VGVTGHADVGVAGHCLACIVMLADQHHRDVGPSAVSPRRTEPHCRAPVVTPLPEAKAQQVASSRPPAHPCNIDSVGVRVMTLV
jgi:hypothetical protein